MNSLTEQETLISASINIFQQDDINSFPILPSQTTPKPPLPQPRARGRQQAVWHVRFSPSPTHSELPRFFTQPGAVRRQSAGRVISLRRCVCWKALDRDGGVRESQELCSSSSLTADLQLCHPSYMQTCQRNSTSISLS